MKISSLYVEEKVFINWFRALLDTINVDPYRAQLVLDFSDIVTDEYAIGDPFVGTNHQDVLRVNDEHTIYRYNRKNGEGSGGIGAYSFVSPFVVRQL